MPKNHLTRSGADNHEREIAIYRGVYALGVCVLPEAQMKVCRQALSDMQGMDYAMVPYSLARSLHDFIDIAVSRKLSYLGKTKLIELKTDCVPGVLRLTKIGDMSMKKLGNVLRSKGVTSH